MERLAEALDLIDHQRRVADAILDTVDVGLVLLDEHGHYQSMNRRQRDFLRLAFPDGHAGRAGQLGLVWDEEGRTRLAQHQMPSQRASRGEEFDDCRIWVGDDPAPGGRSRSRPARSVTTRAGSPVRRWPTRTSPSSCGRCGSRTSSWPRSPTSCGPR